MKKLLINLIGVFVLLFPSLVQGAEEKVIYQQVSIPYFEIWKYSSGEWQDTDDDGRTDEKETDKVYKQQYALDQSFLEKYTVTKVEITVDINETKYNAAGGRDGKIWDDFDKEYFYYRPNKLFAEIPDKNKDLIKGTATAEFSFNLSPEDKGINRKLIRFPGDNEQAFANMTEGWRWYLPAIVTWYGIPKEQPAADLPDAYVKEIKTTATETEAGKTYNATVTYGLKGPYEGIAPCKIGLTHNGYSVYNIDGQKLNLNHWQEKTFEFTFTGQKGKDSVLEAKIWPDAGDKDWSNNNKQLIVPQKAEYDLEAYLEFVSEVESGTTEKLVGWLYNKSDVPVVSKGVWRVNGKIVKTINNVTIPANKGIKTTYDFSIPAGTKTGKTYQVEIEVNPDRNQPAQEKTWSNNKDSGTIEAYLNNIKSDGRLKGDTIID
jgi:hypothetical protein